MGTQMKTYQTEKRVTLKKFSNASIFHTYSSFISPIGLLWYAACTATAKISSTAFSVGAWKSIISVTGLFEPLHSNQIILISSPVWLHLDLSKIQCCPIKSTPGNYLSLNLSLFEVIGRPISSSVLISICYYNTAPESETTDCRGDESIIARKSYQSRLLSIRSNWKTC